MEKIKNKATCYYGIAMVSTLIGLGTYSLIKGLIFYNMITPTIFGFSMFILIYILEDKIPKQKERKR